MEEETSSSSTQPNATEIMRELKKHREAHGCSGGGYGRDRQGEKVQNRENRCCKEEFPYDFDEEDKVLFQLLHRAFPSREDAIKALGIRSGEEQR